MPRVATLSPDTLAAVAADQNRLRTQRTAHAPPRYRDPNRTERSQAPAAWRRWILGESSRPVRPAPSSADQAHSRARDSAPVP